MKMEYCLEESAPLLGFILRLHRREHLLPFSIGLMTFYYESTIIVDGFTW